MSKYSTEFKMQAINMVLNGDSVKHVAKILGIKSTTSLRIWLAHYQHGGINQLLHKNKTYSPEFKKKVIEYKWRYSLSLKETAVHFLIPDKGIIWQWEQKYLTYGFNGLLPKKKGRPSMKYKPKKRKPEPTYVEKLEAENLRLRMEVDFLKKYNALVAEEEEKQRQKQLRWQKQFPD